MGNTPTRPSTINEFDPEKYEGDWWEISKYPTNSRQRYERSKAIYKWDKCQQVLHIKHICYLPNGKITEIIGKAVNNDKINPARLSVSFNSAPATNMPAQYWVHWTDYDRYAIVGNASRSQLIILARNKCPTNSDHSLLKLAVKGFGYNPDRLVSFTETVNNHGKVFNDNSDIINNDNIDETTVMCYEDNDESENISDESSEQSNMYNLKKYNIKNRYQGYRNVKSDSCTAEEDLSESRFWISSNN